MRMDSVTGGRLASAVRGTWLGLVCGLTMLLVGVIVAGSFSSVSTSTWPPPGYSTRWYRNVLNQPGLFDAVSLSLRVAVVTTIITTLLGLGAAIALTRYRFRGRQVVSLLTFAPVVVPKMAFGFAVVIFFNQLDLYGDGTPGLVAAHTVITLPFATTLLAAALVRTDRSVEEAARDLGATPLRAFLSTTLPAIRGAVLGTALLVFIISFDEVDMTAFLLPIDRQTLPVWMFQYMEKYQDPTLAALSTLLLVASLVIAAIAAVALGRSGVFRTLRYRHGLDVKSPDGGERTP